ncbi:GHKL domain-containing protein [Bacillus sp. JJ1532]|uniref:sensor histidine kinase n=1 Tax=unclassified Bacillus (in: firmicutes) TaxID=185979 RepID=UPI002FFDEC95
MILNKIYWATIAVLGFVHLRSVLLNLSFQFPIIIICLFIVCFIFFLYKKVPVKVSILSYIWNSSLFVMQALLVLIYITDKPSWIFLVPFLIFIGIETVRIIWANQLTSFTKKLKEFEEQNNQFNETFRLVRTERHDFLKHVSAIHYLLEDGKYSEAKAYLDELVDGYEETNLSIKGERVVVAGVLHKLYQQAKASDIEVVYDFDLPLSTLPLSDQHVVALIGNLLSNSIDACIDWQKKHKEQACITLQFYKRSGLYLLICKNNSLPIPADILDGLFQTYGKTTKTGDHEGFGTKIIHNIVKDHEGFLDFVYKEHEFTVKIKLPAILG